MEANPARIMDFFNGEKQNVVPVFQRPYTWGDDKLSTLWNDILGIYEEQRESSHAVLETAHFMGAVVTTPVRTVPVGVNKHLVIDGQQRLTTIALLLVALRELAEERRKEQIMDYLVNRHYDDPDWLKIIPTQGDRESFSLLVRDSVSRESRNDRMSKGAQFFLKKLQGVDSNDNTINTEEMFQVIMGCLQVVSISLDEKDDPYLIFESLNFKGEPLSQSDLVRNYILMRFRHDASDGGEQQSVYNEKWRPLEQGLDKELTNFLRHYLVASGAATKTGSVYATFKQHMSLQHETDQVHETLTVLQSWGRHYEHFLNPDKETSPEIRNRLSVIRACPDRP